MSNILVGIFTNKKELRDHLFSIISSRTINYTAHPYKVTSHYGWHIMYETPMVTSVYELEGMDENSKEFKEASQSEQKFIWSFCGEDWQQVSVLFGIKE